MNNPENSIIFTPAKIGPIELRNRTIRSAAFENMCFNNNPSPMLFDYHTSVARGGIGMTTVAYASVNRSGLSFENQLWMRPEIVGELRKLTDAIHAEGAKASIELGHCGNMSHKRTAGRTPISASSGFNLYSPTFVHGMTEDEIHEVARDFGNAVRLAIDAGFDCVEIHAGHGYLISQFLSPYTNKRRDSWGGSLDNRMNFMRLCMEEVMRAADGKIAVVAKTNMRDGFKGGNGLEEGIVIARELEKLGMDALVLSGGFVSKAPMYVMRGEMPITTMTGYMKCWWLKWGVRAVGKYMIKNEEIICPLSIIRNVGGNISNLILRERERGEFSSFIDFAKRMYGQSVNRKVLESLILADCLRNFGENRKTLINNLDNILNSSNN